MKEMIVMGEEGCALRGTGCVGWGEQVVRAEQEVVFIEVSQSLEGACGEERYPSNICSS